MEVVLFKDAEVIVEGQCALSVGNDEPSLNRLQLDDQEKLLLMSSVSSLVMYLSYLEVFSALGQTGLTLASSSTVSAFSTTAAATEISRFDMSCAQAHWVGSKPIRRVMQLKLHKPTMA